MTISCYILYVVISIALTIWLGSTLHSAGRPFLVECFHGETKLADAVNHLLLVGFYLVNIAWIVLSLTSGASLSTIRDAVEFLSFRIGLVSALLGGMHFFNLTVLMHWRRRQRRMMAVNH